MAAYEGMQALPCQLAGPLTGKWTRSELLRLQIPQTVEQRSFILECQHLGWEHGLFPTIREELLGFGTGVTSGFIRFSLG